MSNFRPGDVARPKYAPKILYRIISQNEYRNGRNIRGPNEPRAVFHRNLTDYDFGVSFGWDFPDSLILVYSFHDELEGLLE